MLRTNMGLRNMRTIQPILFCFFLLALLTACSQSTTINLATVNTADLYQLQNVRNVPLSPSSSQSTQLSNLRIRLLQDSGLSIGAQGGLAWASERLNQRMEQDSKYLDTIFNFDAMVLTHGVIPPVLELGDNSLNLADPDTIRVADRTYKIIQQARFATTPPNWREYLWLSFSKPELPDRSLLPRTNLEQRIWRDAVCAGWEKGVAQSYSIFQQNLARLKRDYRGMMIYRKLLQQKMISPPFVARTELGVTGDGTDMRINDQVLRIVEHPKLQTNSRNWKAIVVQNNGY